MAALAAGCALFGLAGWALELAPAPAWAPLVSYILAYLCGGWDAARDAWERLKSGQLDIHFLMLAVAAGAALIGAGFGAGGLSPASGLLGLLAYAARKRK